MDREIIGSNELKKKMQEIIYNQTNIEITSGEAEGIIKEFTGFIKKETYKGNEVLINNFCKFLIKKYKNPKVEGYYDNPVAVFSKNYFRERIKKWV